MNSTEHIHRLANCMKRLMKWPLLCGLLSLNLMCAVSAGDVLFENDAIITYPGTEVNPPVIDATNFVNTGTFIINFTDLFLILNNQSFFETSDTYNYTNSGVMMANAGFRFDTRFSSGTGARTMAANFYNQGSISVGSVANTGDNFLGQLFFVGFIPQCLINATNIVNSGALDVGVDGLIQLTGQHVDLSAGSLNVEGAGANAFGVSGDFGFTTNVWNAQFLGPNDAISGPVPFFKQMFFDNIFGTIFLTNSTAYIDQTQVISNNIIRCVFIEDESKRIGADVSYKIFFNNAQNAFNGGDVTVEWSAPYLDAATGITYTNYLYLTNDYVLGASTNVAFNGNGIPDNFRFSSSPTPLPQGVAPATAGFLNVFTADPVTNGYSFADAQMIATTVSTNQIDNRSMTNLPGRVEISASQQLNLAAAQISGPNYMSVQAPVQFDGSPGAMIQSPFSDINVGVTNGFLTVSNLMSPYVPTWNGEVQAWSTRWLQGNANGGTNDYRVLIIGSVITPTTLAQVQNLIMHGTNSIVLSDTLNVLTSLNADAQNLTLTTNGSGNRATSLDGELNMESSQVFWSSSLPNLRNLTNNGAIRFQNLAQFIGNSNNVVVTPGTNAVAATGKLSEVKSSNVVKNSTVNLGTNQYVFVTTLVNTLPNQVKIAGTLDGSLNNLIAAINRSAGAGTVYSTNTRANPYASAGALVTAGSFTNHSFTVTALASGADGNLIRSTNTSVSLAWNGLNLSGGMNAVAGTTNITPTVLVPYENFVSRGLLSDQGSAIWAKNFESSGAISNWVGSFTLDSLTTTLTNGSITAAGDISISAASLVTSNIIFQTSRSVTLRVTNLLTDSSVTNGNIWSVQATNGPGGNALIMPVKPALGDLLGTTITNYAPLPNRQSLNVWAGQDRGVSVSGFTNNAAVGRLYLDALGFTSQFKFSGASISNALYVDDLEFRDSMTNGIDNNFDFSVNLSISPGMMIYFAQATTADGTSIAAKIDEASKAGRNGGRLRWVPSYAGHFSSVNVVYPDGTTNTVNAALASSSTADSNGNGIPNGSDPAPFFVSSQIGLNIATTNAPAPAALIRWSSIPGSTNYIYYKTDLASSTWLTLTNFVSPAIVPPAGGWPIINTVFDPMNSSQPRFYNVTVIPNSASLNGQ